ncbi:MAG: AAA family ATPase [Mariniblastus sp.]
MNEFGSAADEFVEFGCPQCSTRLKVSVALVGKPAKCPKCAAVTDVPNLKMPADSTLPVPTIAPNIVPEVTPVVSSGGDTNIGAETETRKLFERIKAEVSKVFVGQDELVRGTLVALFSGGHVLIESVPGLGKTLFVRTLGQILGCDFGRIQFTADLMPSDITGAPIFNMKSQEFEFRAGPVFTQLLLADEINRSPAKTHAALLEIMQEKRVTIDGDTHTLDLPFLVVATQNPIESEGTYNLPEAQLDRFMFKLSAGYPSEDQEAQILMKHGGQSDLDKQLEEEIHQITSPEQIVAVTKESGNVRIDPLLVKYINKIVRLTREWPQFYMGASPRAGISLMQGARTLAAFCGRDYAVPDDVIQIALPSLRHRVQLTAEAEVEGQSVDQLLQDLIRTIEVPRLK